MTVAGKIYKTHNTPSQLEMLTDFSLESAGIAEKDLRKQVLAAVRKAGYKSKSSPSSRSKSTAPSTSAAKTTAKAGSSTGNGKSARKRKRDDDLNELLPSKPPEEGDAYGSLEFHEILDEEVIKTKYTVVNRAPIMMAWAFVVAERQGFGREEALSIASVYTEMNAMSKGVSLGIYRDGQQRGMEASRTGSQPYVELMGRRIPLYQTASAQWRALSAGTPAAPASAFSYITRALRQTAPHIVGALRLLAASYAPAELNTKGFGLYAEFRPAAGGWGERGEVRCDNILGLRKPQGTGGEGSKSEAIPSVDTLVKVDAVDESRNLEDRPTDLKEPSSKKLKREPPEQDEYDAALDDDALFADFDLSTIP
ncbi:hypothetical protein C8Q78DRAFT_99427 [Trametes maxima]|nr:hypothetical protein C8Q78DRAFT_99427 [Trametes maxima]